MSSVVNGNGILTEKPVVRLCHVVKWPDYDGYGFNLHAEKNKPGQFIGKVDEGSPAEAAGLKEGDRIIEVNGSDISGDDHKSVVNRIKGLHAETQLLVVDKASSDYFAANNITITSKLPEVVKMKTPPRAEVVNGQTTNGSSSTSTTPTTTPEPRLPNVSSSASVSSESPKSQKSINSSSSEKRDENNKLNLKMSVSEFRNQLAAKKRVDPKKDTIDLKKKYDIIDSL